MHSHDFDWDHMAERLVTEGELLAPFVDGALTDLARRLSPRRILDVGAGPGVAACAAARLFPDAEVIAADGSAELLERAGRRAKDLGVELTTLRADFPADLDDLPPADLIWTSNVLHHVGDQGAAVAALAARLRPGGILAVAEGGLPIRSLPRELGFGRPGLQARLEVARAEWFDAMRHGLEQHAAVTEDWPALLAAAGLGDAGSRSYLVDRPAPLAPEHRAFVRSEFERFGEVGEHLSAEDRGTLARLLDPQDPGGLALRADVFVLTARTVHTAVAR